MGQFWFQMLLAFLAWLIGCAVRAVWWLFGIKPRDERDEYEDLDPPEDDE